MPFFDRRTVSVLTTVLAFAGFLGLVWLARLPIIAFIIAIFFAQLLEPIIGQFQKWFRVSRGKAVAITYVVIFGVLAVFGATLGPRILDQAQRLAQTLPSLFEQVRTGSIAWQVGGQHGWSIQTESWLQDWLIQHQNEIAQTIRDVTLRI